MNSYQTSLMSSDCTGCSACVNICSHQALTMCEDNEGFLYPKIEKDKCVDCNLCRLVCPIQKPYINKYYNNQKAYVSSAVNTYFSHASATIGMCTMLAKWVIREGGIVYGCWLDETDWKPQHIRVDSEVGIEKIRNSKYAQSHIGNCFVNIKDELKKGKTILFVGTPCQVAGLKSFLKKEYINLYTVDLICHGVFSYKLLQKEIAYWERIFSGKVRNFQFRSKRKYPYSFGGVVNFDLFREGEFVKHIERYAAFSPVYRLYAYSPDSVWYNLRPSCYSCKFRDRNRIGDMSIGDPHGVSPLSLGRFSGKKYRKNGISLSLVNSYKGDIMLNGIKQHLRYKEIPFDSAFSQQALFPEKLDIPRERYEIYANYMKCDLGDIVERMYNINLEDENRKFEFEWKKRKIICDIKDAVKIIIFYKYWKK